MRFAALLSLTLLAALPLRAECVGQNLIAALPADQLATLRAAAEVPFATGNLWTATKSAQTITLIGTFHMDDPRHAATVAAVADEVARATALLVEAGPTEEAALKSHLARHPERLINTGGPTLPEALPDADWQRLSVALNARGIAPVFAAKLRPWYLSTMLAVPPCQFGQTAEAGLDRRLIALATAKGVPVVGLEPYDTVFAIFDSFSGADQLRMLMQTLDADVLGDDMAVTVADSYFAGENRLFWQFSKLQLRTLSGLTVAEADREFAMVEEVLLNRRNRAWVPVITAAAEKGPLVVAFGALHLSGPEGVLNLLAQAGWNVTPVAP